MDEIIKELSEIYPDLRVEDYKKQFNMLYGATILLNTMNDEIKADIICIEKNRLSDNRQSYNVSPKEFIKQYSKISFFLAKERYFRKTTYTAAIILIKIFEDFLEDNKLTWLEKKLLKKEISETILDLEYASEIGTLYSLRMKSLIQQNANS